MRWRMTWANVAVAAAILGPLPPVGFVRAAGTPVAGFTLEDVRGKQHSLDDLAGEQLVVIAFLGTECPLAKLYSPRLARLHQAYGPRGVAFVAINSNVHDSLAEIAASARTHGLEFPVLKDPGNRVADQFGATRTPEVFVLDRDRVIRYSGRIDDQYGVGYVREKPGRNELADALDELLAGKSVTMPRADPVGCLIGRVRKPEAGATVTYSNRIAPILRDRCVECHRSGDIAPFALTTYDEAAGWAEMIAEVVRDQRMPPWHASGEFGSFHNDRSLSDDDKKAIEQWAKDGAPEGDPAGLPAAQTFVEGWQLPQPPDLVLPIQAEPFRIQAEGEVAYQWFIVDPGFTADTWIKGVEIVPGNRAVVHHILAFVRMPDDAIGIGEGKGYFAGYVPGVRADALPDGMARLVPAGARLAFQVHYTPVGTVQEDLSRIGLVFADPATITHRVVSSSALQRDLEIPAREANYRAEAKSRRIPWSTLLLSMSPHMHLRGKTIRYEAEYPDGTREVLLDVPRYDFNWQTEYRLTNPLTLPPGTRIHAVAHFDNSATNPSNPDPDKTVSWGDQSWDEMMIGYFTIAVPAAIEIAVPESDLRGPAEVAADSERKTRKMFHRLDANGDAALTIGEVPLAMKAAFWSTDKDGSGTVSEGEFIAVVAEYLKTQRPAKVPKPSSAAPGGE